MKWRGELSKFFKQYGKKIETSLWNTDSVPASIPFVDFFIEHAFSVMKEAIIQVESEQDLDKASKVKLSRKPPQVSVPKSLKELMKLWDRWRKTGDAPKRALVIAKALAHDTINKIQNVWQRSSEEFRSGDDADKEKVVKRVRKALNANYARAKMIVETETTFYYNQVRKDFYDESEDVTHYLFVAIRDQRTTQWCRTRHGLVYAKDDPILEIETPPIHWNCRSELLPLTPENPKHKLLIDAKSNARRNHSPTPLPKNWRGR